MRPDLIMVLSGEDTKERHRSKKAIEVYQRFDGEAPILVSGSHSGYLGREVPKRMTRECHQARDYLISQGIPERDISCEEASLDTIGNFYFSYPLIGEHQNRIDLVTDEFHMNRSMWCARLVFGDSKVFVPSRTTQTGNTYFKRVMEELQVILLSQDMKKYDVKDGDYEALSRFMNDVHPFYCQDQPGFSMFGLMVRLFKNKRLREMLPTQKQAYKDSK